MYFTNPIVKYPTDMKKFFVFLSSLLFVFLAGCSANQQQQEIEQFIEARIDARQSTSESGSASATTSASDAQKTVIYVPKKKNDLFNKQMGEALAAVLAEQDIQLEVRAPRNEDQLVAEQIQIIQEATIAKVDAIVVVPGDDKSLIPALKKAQEANIPIITMDSSIDDTAAKNADLKPIPFITISNQDAAYSSVKTVLQNQTAPIKALILTGDQNSLNARQRMDGAVQAIEEIEASTVVNVVDGKWKRDEGYAIAQQNLATTPDINVIVCGNDGMALGVLQLLEEQQKTDITLIGFDAVDEAVEAVSAGKMAATVRQDPNDFGAAAAKALTAIFHNDSVQDTITVQTQLVQ